MMASRTTNLHNLVHVPAFDLPPGKNAVFGFHPDLVKLPGPPLPDLPLRNVPAFQAPANASPQDLFTHLQSEHKKVRCHPHAFRFVRRTNDREVLVYVDGSCLDQNSPDNFTIRRAGCGWTFKPGTSTSKPESYAIRLERKGPDGEDYPQTSNRAELRAALGALEFRMWPGEKWSRMVIATDSEYVFLGITMRIQTWAARGWRTSAGQAVKNQDLWKRLLERINYFAKYGLEVVFWKIPREQNQYADRAANEGARKSDVENFTKHEGVLQ